MRMVDVDHGDRAKDWVGCLRPLPVSGRQECASRCLPASGLGPAVWLKRGTSHGSPGAWVRHVGPLMDAAPSAAA